MMIGFTIIAFGTSLPELIVSVFANMAGSPGIALGNVIGSNIANLLLVLGCSALFVTLKTKVNKSLIRDLIFMLLATIALAALLNHGQITRTYGFAMLVVLGTYIFVQFKTSEPEDFEAVEPEEMGFENDKYAYLALFGGLTCIAIGAEFLVKGAQVSAGLIGVPESVIALSLIALGTSLPELSTSIIAARKNQSEMVIGNIIGSNVFNILLILGVASLIAPINQGSFEPQLAQFDIWVTLSVSVICAAVLFFSGKINRITGGLFFLLYIVYNVYIYATNIGA